MSLTWSEGQHSIAMVGKKTLFLNDSVEQDSFSSIELKGNDTFQQIPNKHAERDVLYISAMSGSGKSYYTAEYTKHYHKLHPKNDIFLFSSVDEDKCLDAIKSIKRFKIKTPAFLEDSFDARDFANSLCIFDDVDVISDKKIKIKVFGILDSLLQTGRHYNTSVIFTSHNATQGNSTKTILNEATSITLFPRTSGNKSLKYIADQYIGLDSKQTAELKKVKGRWVTIIRAYPRCMLTETTCKLL